VLSFDPGMVSRPSREMLDEVVIDIKMFNGSVDVLRYAQLHNGENILRKRVPRLSYSNYRAWCETIMDGGIHIQQLFFEI
jgi:hypothetical protein